MTTFTPGDVSGSQTLQDVDHLYPSHINELRVAIASSSPFITVANDGTGTYNCDGVADQVEINQAIASLTSGGMVLIKKGTYHLSAKIIIKLDKITLVGEGKGTILSLDNAVNQNVIQVGVNASTTDILYYPTIKDLSIVGNSANQTVNCNGINLRYVDKAIVENVFINDVKYLGISGAPCTNSQISKCTVTNPLNTGIFFGDTSENITISDCICTGSLFDGITLDSTVSGSHGGNHTITGCFCNDNAASGIYLDPGVNYVTMVGNVCNRNGNIGFDISDTCANCIASSNIANDNTSYGLSTAGPNTIIIGNTAFNNGTANIAGLGDSTHTSSNNVINGNRTSGSTIFGILTTAGCNFNVIVGNNNKGCGTVTSLGGTADVVASNI